MTEMRRSMPKSGAGVMAAPNIVDLKPSSGKAQGGDQIVIKGSSFELPVKVFFDKTHGKVDQDKSNNTTIYCATPAHAPGRVQVHVENADGTPSNNASFEYK